jgi:hypothetical protein
LGCLPVNSIALDRSDQLWIILLWDVSLSVLSGACRSRAVQYQPNKQQRTAKPTQTVRAQVAVVEQRISSSGSSETGVPQVHMRTQPEFRQ